MPGGEEGIEMKDFSTSLRRRESDRKLTTGCFSDENYLRMVSETGVSILELDAQSSVTKNSTQMSSEKPPPLHLHEHGFELDPQSSVAKNNTQISSDSHTLSDVGDDENRTLAAAKASPIIVRSPLRRSVRIAKRRSIGQHAQAGCLSPLLKEGSFPAPSLLSPVC